MTGRNRIGRRLGVALVALMLFAGCTDETTLDTTGRDSAGQVTSSGEVDLVKLRVGDCIPTSALPDAPSESESEAAKDIQHLEVIPCDQRHAGEVILVEDYPSAGDDSYPGLEQLTTQGYERCATAVQEYTGQPFDGSPDEYTYTWYMPTREDWSQRDRTLVCVGMTAAQDGQNPAETTGSIRAPQ